jgi:hypothetical protein
MNELKHSRDAFNQLFELLNVRMLQDMLIKINKTKSIK